MITRLLHLLQQLTGTLLGFVGVGIQLGNVLICIFMLLLGPTFVVGLFTR
jgi:hypothetical protein